MKVSLYLLVALLTILVGCGGNDDEVVCSSSGQQLTTLTVPASGGAVGSQTIGQTGVLPTQSPEGCLP
jgi:hypothetical protein